MSFNLKSNYDPSDSQKKAVEILYQNFKKNHNEQILLGVTGSGKTFTMAQLINKTQQPTLIIAHNKTLAAQLFEEFKLFFPDNAVEFFISYYDYYQPEAYIASRDTYIEKEAQINEEIERYRHRATQSLVTRKDVIIIASVSCIYGLGMPEDYVKNILSISQGQEISPRNLILNLEKIQYERHDFELKAGRYRLKGDCLSICPASENFYYHVEFFGDEIELIECREMISDKLIQTEKQISIFPATHYLLDENRKDSLELIKAELNEQIALFTKQNKLLEANRIKSRTNYDLELLEEIGYCKGIENYSQPLSGRPPGSAPGVLMDFFPDDFLVLIDESHVTMPQLKGMHSGDQSRKQSLIDYGFRLPSARDNRPLMLKEFEKRREKIVYVSATPGPYEMQRASKNTFPKNWSDYFLAELIIRPTGLLDPHIIVKKTKGQMQDLLTEIKICIDKKERVLVTTLTKKFAEDLAVFFQEKNIKSQYLHSDITALDRVKILNELRQGKYDVLIGINLLREGLDLPEVSLVAILDADKEGFLRNERSLIQTIGRAARHVNGRAILYADKMTPSMDAAINETLRRRKIQEEYNQKHKIIPKSVQKNIRKEFKEEEVISYEQENIEKSGKDIIESLEKQMLEAAENLEFELAAKLRDEIDKLRSLET